MMGSLQILIKFVLCVQLCTAFNMEGGCFDDEMDTALKFFNKVNNTLYTFDIPYGDYIDRQIGSQNTMEIFLQIGKVLSDLYCKFGRLILAPAIEKVKKEMEKINVQIKELGPEEEELKRESLITLANTKKKLDRIRQNLETLADQTIQYSKGLIELLNDEIDTQSTQHYIKEKIPYQAEKMINIINKSVEALDKARNDYDRIYSNLSKVSMNMKEFNERINKISNKVSNEIESIQGDIDDYECQGTGFWSKSNPICLAIYYLFGLPRNKPYKVIVKDYKTTQQQLKNISQSLEPFESEHSKLNESIKVEIGMIRDWKTKLDAVLNDFESIETLAKKIFEDKQSVILMLENLEQSCKKYVDHVSGIRYQEQHQRGRIPLTVDGKNLVLDKLKPICEKYLESQLFKDDKQDNYEDLRDLKQSCEDYLRKISDND